MAVELILGGARSGKSVLAEERAAARGQPVSYVATARVEDGEMVERVALHRARRPDHWELVEEPVGLAWALRRLAASDRVVLVDCLTLWLTNLLMDEDPGLFQRERRALLEALHEAPGQVILVSNEVGMGVVPMGELSRRFVDETGRLHQEIGALAERVVLVTAGLPLVLKGDAL